MQTSVKVESQVHTGPDRIAQLTELCDNLVDLCIGIEKLNFLGSIQLARIVASFK